MRAVVLAGVALLLLGSVPARGQYVDYYSVRREHMVPGARPSVRLLGMGQLSLTIEDENNEINLSDFGGNAAGIAEDRDSWSVETWGGGINTGDNYVDPSTGIPTHGQVNRQLGGFDAVYRKSGKRAIGLTGLYDGQENSVSRGPRTKISGPDVSFLWNEIRQPFSVAIRIGTWSDNQDIVSPDVFAIRNFSGGWVTTFAGAWNVRGWQLGGQFDLDRATVRGKSRDPSGFHQDDFTWKRPATYFRLNLIRPESHRLAAGVNLTAMRRNGNEDGTFSWSDRWVFNPSRIDWQTRVPTLQEKDRDWGLEGRARYRLVSDIQLGASGSYQVVKTKVDEDPSGNFPGSLPPQDTELKGWRIGAGLGGTWLDDRLRAGVEGFAEERRLTSRQARTSETDNARTFSLYSGAEILLPSRVAFRGGYILAAYDENLDQPLSLYKSNGFTAGIGYMPSGGIISLDAALRILQLRPDYEGGPARKTDVQDIEVAARFLF